MLRIHLGFRLLQIAADNLPDDSLPLEDGEARSREIGYTLARYLDNYLAAFIFTAGSRARLVAIFTA